MIKTCPTCEKEFSAHQKATIYCCSKCYHDATFRGVFVTCPTCGKKSRRSPTNADRVFCSRKCYDASRAAKYVTKLCPVCGQQFTVRAIVANRYTVCSRACRTADTRYVTCKRCGKVFTGKTDHNRGFCSEECR